MTDLLLVRAALRDALRPRRLVVALLLVLLPSLMGLAARWFASETAGVAANPFVPDQTYDNLMVYVVFGFTITILSVIYGTGIVSQELEQRTIVYLLTRPLPRWRILLAKFVVAWAFVAAVGAVSTILLAITIYGPSHLLSAGILPDIRSLLVGSLAYSALFLLVGASLPRPLIYSLLFVFGWETIVPVLPGSFARASIMTYLRVLASREIADSAASSSTPGDPTQFLLSTSRAADLDISYRAAWITLLAVSLVCLVLAFIVFSRREYVPREDE